MVSSKKLPEIALQHLVFLYILSLHLVLTLSAGANGSSDIWLSLLAIPVCGLMVACACYYCHYCNSKRRGHERPQAAPVAPSPMLPPPFVNSASPPCQVQPLLGFDSQLLPPPPTAVTLLLPPPQTSAPQSLQSLPRSTSRQEVQMAVMASSDGSDDERATPRRGTRVQRIVDRLNL